MLPVVIVTSVSPELAATATERLLSRGGTVGISYAGHPQRRVIRTSSEVVDVCDVERESDCATCDIASDAAGATALLADLGRWTAVVICLPTAMAAGGLVARLSPSDAEPDAGPQSELVSGQIPTGPSGAFVRSVLVVVDAATLRSELSGDELLDERGLASSDHDRRSVAEAIVAQIEYADTLLLSGIEDAGVPEPEMPLIRELVARLNPGAHSTTCSELPDLVAPSRSPRSRAAFDVAAARARVEPGVISAPLRDTAYGVTTVVWRAARPMHPRRLCAALTDLVDGVARSRGRLWLANRPTQMLAWESAGGSASLDVLGSWLADTATQDWGQLPTALRASAALGWDDLVGDRCCELSLTGTLPDPGRLRELLDSCLLSDLEYGAGPASWSDIADPFVDALGVADAVPQGVRAQEWR
jgi:G3E family GTPase